MTTQHTTGTVPEFTLGDRLRKARELAGHDKETFAKILGIARGSVANYESGTTTPRRPVLREWARVTSVDLAWIESGHSPVPDPGCRDAASRRAALNKLAEQKAARRRYPTTG